MKELTFSNFGVQLTLTPRARSTDVDTSHLAAASVTNITERQQAVLRVLKSSDDPLTQEELVLYYKTFLHPLLLQTDSGIRTRLSELVRMGCAEMVPGVKRRMSTGRLARVWRAK